MDNLNDLASMFKALGDPTRLKIFEFLRACSGPVTIDDSGDVRRVNEPTVGEICCHITGHDRTTSTISFHLKELRQAGLIAMKRNGKNILYTVNPEASVLITDYLSRESTVDTDCCGE